MNKKMPKTYSILFAVVFTAALLTAFNVVVNAYRQRLKIDDVERITIYCRGYWDQGTGYRSASSVNVYADGRVISEVTYTLSGSNTVEMPEHEYTEAMVGTEAFENLVHKFNRNGFPGLNDSLSDYGVCDGGEFYIEVEVKDEVYRKGGANPSNKKFLACYDAVVCLRDLAAD